MIRNVAIQHPIVYFDLNICELVQKRTLTTLRVDRLRDMCIDLRHFTSEEEKAIYRTSHTISPGEYLLFQVTEH